MDIVKELIRINCLLDLGRVDIVQEIIKDLMSTNEKRVTLMNEIASLDSEGLLRTREERNAGMRIIYFIAKAGNVSPQELTQITAENTSINYTSNKMLGKIRQALANTNLAEQEVTVEDIPSGGFSSIQAFG